jgi:PmbA protein
MDLQNFKEKLFAAAKAAGLAEYELYAKRNASFGVNIFEGQIDEYKSEQSLGVCFRGKADGKMGYAFSEKIDDGVIAFLVDNVTQNAAVIEDPEEEHIYGGDPAYPAVDCYNPALDKVPAEAKIEAAMQIERAAKATDNRVENVPYCYVGNDETEVFIANSKGLNVTTKSNCIAGMAETQVEGADEQVKTAFDIYVGPDFDKLNPDTIGQTSAKKALASLGASPVTSGKYAVVFNREAASGMLDTWTGAFSAEQAHKGFSILAGKLGESIAADCVTIIDDPLLPNHPKTTPFDSEGVASRTKTVVDGGVFKTFLHNTKTARKDGVEPTGNGFKWDYALPVDIAPTNFYIKPGAHSHDALLEKMGSGVVITGVEGLHSGANETSGDFSLSASGFLVEGGQVTRPVDQITISGNFFTMLKDIVAVGSNLEFTYSGTVAPSLYVRELDIAGE